MRLPDKICIFPDDNDEFWYKPEEWETPPPKRVEYLRKDALLEWAKEKANDYKGTANIRRSFEMMIRKIESL